MCILSLCGWITTLQCMLWEKQPGHEVENFNFFYEFTKAYLFYNCRSIRTKPRRSTPSISVLFFCGLIKNTPVYTFGDIAWTRGRICTKFLSFFMNLKSLSFLQFFIDSSLHTLQYLLYPFAD